MKTASSGYVIDKMVTWIEDEKWPKSLKVRLIEKLGEHYGMFVQRREIKIDTMTRSLIASLDPEQLKALKEAGNGNDINPNRLIDSGTNN